MDEVQIGIALIVIYFLHRWWSSSSTSATSSSVAGGTSLSSDGSSTDPRTARYNALATTIPPTQIEQAQSMFPQLDERNLRWHFVRTGRLRTLDHLAQELLDERTVTSIPPTGFLPIQQPSPSTSAPTSQPKSAKFPSLIERLGIEAQAITQDGEFAAAIASGLHDGGKGKGKATDVGWKSLSMQEKKERWVLDARRHLHERDTKQRRQSSLTT